MKRLIILSFSCIIIVVMSTGCLSPTIGVMVEGTKLACTAVSAISNISSSSPSGAIKEATSEYSIGKNTVKLSITNYKGRGGYLFTAFDSNNQELGKVFYYVGDKNNMQEYNQFQEMNPEAKKQFIYQKFLACNVDLGPIESETVTYKTPPTSTTPPDIPISGFAPAVTPAFY